MASIGKPCVGVLQSLHRFDRCPRTRLPLVRIALSLLPLGARALAGQTASSTAVHVVVRDSTRRAIGGADVTIVRGLNIVLAGATTDERGTVTLAVAPDRDNYELVVRRIGYERVDRFIRVGSDSVTFDVPMRPVAQELAGLTVTAERNLKRESYHIDADDIAKSDRVLLDATDIVSKLRPDMICGRECNPMAGVQAATRAPIMKCPGLVMDGVPTSCPADERPVSLYTNVWVNGEHIRLIPPDVMAMARQTGMLSGFSPGAMTVLSEIKPEHIEEMNYLDSMDTWVDKPGAIDALFITLKPGVAYTPGRGSYVLAVAHAATAKDSNATKAPAQLAQYRYRLLGVFDEATGDPITGAEVLDVETGDRTKTSSSGIVSLVFLPDGGSPLRITKPGYEDLTLAVQISPDNMTPLTLTMVRKRER